MKFRATVLVLFLLACAAFAQSDYSESSPFEPRREVLEERSRKSKGGESVPQLVPLENVVDTVSIPILVRDQSGAPVTDLTRGELKIFVDNAPVQIISVEKPAEPPGVVLVLDTSPSAVFQLKTLLQQAQRFVDRLPASVKVIVVEFNSEMNIRCQLTGDREQLRKCISKARMGDGTSIYSAVGTLFQKVLPLVPGRKWVVMFTDGVDTTSRGSSYSSSLAQVELSDVPVFGVYYDTSRQASSGRPSDDWLRAILASRPDLGPGRGTLGSTSAEYVKGRDYLADLAAASGGRIIKAGDFDKEAGLVPSELLSYYYATIQVPKSRSGSRPVKVRVLRPKLGVTARGSFIEK